MGDKGSSKRKKKSRPQEEDSDDDVWDSEDDDDTIARIQRAHFAQAGAINSRRRAPARPPRMSNKRKLEAVRNFHDFTKKLKKDTGISIRSLVGNNILELSEFSSEDSNTDSDGLSEEEFVVNPNAVHELNEENESYIDPETGDFVQGKKVERKKSLSKSPEPLPESESSVPPKTLSISDIINEELDLSKNVEIAEVEESELCPEKDLLTMKGEDSSSQDFDMKKLTEMDEISVKPVKPEEEQQADDEQKMDTEEEKKPTNPNALNVRRNIREVMDEKNLDASTLAAQRQESERLARVQEQQRIIREVQRQIAINRQNKIHQKTLSLLQGGSSILKKSTGQKLNLPNTVLVKLPSGEVKKTAMKQGQVEVTKVIKPGPSGQKIKKEVVEIVDSSSGEESSTSSSDSDDCIMLSDSEVPPSPEADEDPGNSGLHVNDAYNTPDEQGRVLINIGHTDTEEDIFLAPQIARIIKPHQIGGVRFLFDNIIESVERFSTSTGFGCILAHSMGLGKTLQIVCFCDIFLRHTNSKTVLCIMPINTLQNWVAEFNMWLPIDATNSPLAVHGEVRPRQFPIYVLNDSHKTLQMRAKVVKDWKSTGGVLMIGYELYRLLSMKKDKKPRKKKEKKVDAKFEGDDKKIDTGNDDTQDSKKADDIKFEREDGDSLGKTDLDLVKDEKKDDPNDEDKKLLDEMYEALVRPGPDLVICDEGHRIKNSHSNISYALKQMRTKRRIVLTGYPLQNNLLEYWCMVDFVRPNYLGSKTEFCNMFERPIQNGQCIDSTPQDIRLMRYRAHVLHSLLVGFVQRRSHAVLQSTLPQKEEYVLLVRMTPLQRKLYDVFMNEVVRSTSVPNPLKAFAICCKIWNHPDVLYNFLRKRSEVNAAIEEDLDLEEIGGVTKAGRAKKAPGRKPGKPRGSAKKPAATIQPNVAGPKSDPRGSSGPPYTSNGPYGPQTYRPEQSDRAYPPYPPYQGPGYYPPNQGFDQQYDNSYYPQQQQQPYGNNYPNQYPPNNPSDNQGYNQNYWGGNNYYNNTGFYGNSEQFENNQPPADFNASQQFRNNETSSIIRSIPQEFPNNQIPPPIISGPQQFPGNQPSQDFRGNPQQLAANQPLPDFRGNPQPISGNQPPPDFRGIPEQSPGNQVPLDFRGNPHQFPGNQPPPDFRGNLQQIPSNQPPSDFRRNPQSMPGNQPSSDFRGNPQQSPGNQPPHDFRGNPQQSPGNQPPHDFRGNPHQFPGNQPPPNFRSNSQQIPSNQPPDFRGNPQQVPVNQPTPDFRGNSQQIPSNQTPSDFRGNPQPMPGNQPPLDFRGNPQESAGNQPPPDFRSNPHQFPNNKPPPDFRGNAQAMTGNQPPPDYRGNPQQIPSNQPPIDFRGTPHQIPGNQPPLDFRGNIPQFPRNQPPPDFRGNRQPIPGNQISPDFRDNPSQYQGNETPDFRGSSQQFPNNQSSTDAGSNSQVFTRDQPPSDLRTIPQQFSNNQQSPDLTRNQPYIQGPLDFRGISSQFPNNQASIEVRPNQQAFTDNEAALDVKPNPPPYANNQQLTDIRTSQPLFSNNQQSTSESTNKITPFPNNQAQDCSRNEQQFGNNVTPSDSRGASQLLTNNQSASSTEMNRQQYSNNPSPDFRRTPQQYTSGQSASDFSGASQQYPSGQPPDFRPNSQPYSNNQSQPNFGNNPQSYNNDQSTSELIKSDPSEPYNSRQYPSNYNSSQGPSTQPYTGNTLQPYNPNTPNSFSNNQRPFDESSFHNTQRYSEYNQNPSPTSPYPSSQSQNYSTQNYPNYPANSPFGNDTSSYNQFGNQPQNYTGYGNQTQNNSLTEQPVKSEIDVDSNYQSIEKKCDAGLPQNPREISYGSSAYNFSQSNTSMYPDQSTATCTYSNYGPPIETKTPLGSGSPITPWAITETLKTEVDKIKAEEKIEMKSESDGEVKIEDLDTKKIVKDETNKCSNMDSSLKAGTPAAIQSFPMTKKAARVSKSDESETEKEIPKKNKRGRPKGSKNGEGKARQKANTKAKGRKDRKTSKEKNNEEENESEESEKEEKLNKEETLALVKKAEEMTYDWATELLKDYIPGIIENSAKMELFFYLLNESIKLGDRILLFSQSLFTLNLIEDFLVRNYIPGTHCLWERNTSYFRLDGSTHALEREKLINEFNANPNIYLFLVSTRAGSLGINLVGANRVIVFDASWNPCHDTQAVCRVYRYGQKKPCFVYRFVMDCCLEKKIYDRQINKQGMADRVVDECNPDAVLSMKEITNLCFDNDEKESEPKDLSEHKDKYIDVLMQGIIKLHGKLLSKEPFQHESLLVDRKEKKLSSAEKRLAQRGYEMEKKAASAPKPTGAYRTVRAADGSLVQRPVASVRPMQHAGARWIPADVWRRQGMTAQEMTLPLDVVIPTNSTEKTNIVLKAGQRVMVLKSPKGIYMQLESGKIIAIKTSLKGLQKGGDKDNPVGKKVIASRPLSTNIPGSLKNNSAITITSKTGPRPGFNRVLTRPSMVQNKMRPVLPGQKLADIRNRLGELRSMSPIRGKSLIPQGRLLRPNLPGSVSITRILKEAKKTDSDSDSPAMNKINIGSEDDAQILDSDDEDENSTKEDVSSNRWSLKDNDKCINRTPDNTTTLKNNAPKNSLPESQHNKTNENEYNNEQNDHKEPQEIILTTDEKLPSEEALENKTTEEIVDMSRTNQTKPTIKNPQTCPSETIERKINLLKNYRHQRLGNRPQTESSLSQLEKTASVLNNEGAPDFRKHLDDITQSYSPGLEDKSVTKSKKKKSPAKTSNIPEPHNDILPNVANMSHSVSNLLGNSSSMTRKVDPVLPHMVPPINAQSILPSHGNQSLPQDSSMSPMPSRGPPHGYSMAQNYSVSPLPSASPGMSGVMSSSSTSPSIDAGKITGVPRVPTPVMATPTPTYPPGNPLPPDRPYGQYPGYGMGFGPYPGGWEYGGYGAAPPYYPGYGAPPYAAPAPAHAPLPAHPVHPAHPSQPPEGFMPPNPQW